MLRLKNRLSRTSSLIMPGVQNIDQKSFQSFNQSVPRYARHTINSLSRMGIHFTQTARNTKSKIKHTRSISYNQTLQPMLDKVCQDVTNHSSSKISEVINEQNSNDEKVTIHSKIYDLEIEETPVKLDAPVCEIFETKITEE